jgi:hypothetical protein
VGLRWDGTVRYGASDGALSVEGGLARSSGRARLRVGGYRRLASQNDWGYPFTLGESTLAALWGRDEGFYVRSAGADVTGVRDGAWSIAWRLFAEQQEAVPVASRWSLFGGAADGRFISNTTARDGGYAGASARLRRTWGGDPGGWRVFADVRGEAAGGAAGYGRLAAEGALTRDLGHVSLSVGVGAGTSVGDLPPQRRWFLGGARTVRGQEAGALAGSAFRLAHAEAAVPIAFLKAAVFADAGWAGDRRDLWRGGRPLSGAGVGLSALNGLVRVDVATGLAPRRPGPRVDITLDARF